jgi:hypothetical protein
MSKELIRDRLLENAQNVQFNGTPSIPVLVDVNKECLALL